jgi:hypothetical protein
LNHIRKQNARARAQKIFSEASTRRAAPKRTLALRLAFCFSPPLLRPRSKFVPNVMRDGRHFFCLWYPGDRLFYEHRYRQTAPRIKSTILLSFDFP